MTSNHKRRAHPRVPAGGIAVSFTSSDGRASRTERISNVSLGGVFIEMDDPLGFGHEISLEFSVPGRTIRCGGVVMWTTRSGGGPRGYDGPPGMGIRLTHIAVADMRALAAFIESKLS